MSNALTLKRLLEAAVTMGETPTNFDVKYVHDLYLQSDECRESEALRRALGGLVDAVNVEFPGGMRDIGGKTGAALIQAVNALAKPPFDVAAVTEAQAHNHEKPLQLD